MVLFSLCPRQGTHIMKYEAWRLLWIMFDLSKNVNIVKPQHNLVFNHELLFF